MNGSHGAYGSVSSYSKENTKKDYRNMIKLLVLDHALRTAQIVLRICGDRQRSNRIVSDLVHNKQVFSIVKEDSAENREVTLTYTVYFIHSACLERGNTDRPC